MVCETNTVEQQVQYIDIQNTESTKINGVLTKSTATHIKTQGGLVSNCHGVSGAPNIQAVSWNHQPDQGQREVGLAQLKCHVPGEDSLASNHEWYAGSNDVVASWMATGWNVQQHGQQPAHVCGSVFFFSYLLQSDQTIF